MSVEMRQMKVGDGLLTILENIWIKTAECACGAPQ